MKKLKYLIPALLVRTTARIDLSTLPWATLTAFFGPAVAMLLLSYVAMRGRTAPSSRKPSSNVMRPIESWKNTADMPIVAMARAWCA